MFSTPAQSTLLAAATYRPVQLMGKPLVSRSFLTQSRPISYTSSSHRTLQILRKPILSRGLVTHSHPSISVFVRQEDAPMVSGAQQLSPHATSDLGRRILEAVKGAGKEDLQAKCEPDIQKEGKDEGKENRKKGCEKKSKKDDGEYPSTLKGVVGAVAGVVAFAIFLLSGGVVAFALMDRAMKWADSVDVSQYFKDNVQLRKRNAELESRDIGKYVGDNEELRKKNEELETRSNELAERNKLLAKKRQELENDVQHYVSKWLDQKRLNEEMS
ncbi:MAG: hypothetical protein M1820_008749 [Bogoriella megaspora]|nr:MAG: hypothetical protein M1820_008749 [Bogoriella megaspora]